MTTTDIIRKPIVMVLIACSLLLVIPLGFRMLTAEGYPLGYGSFSSMNRMDLDGNGLIAKDHSLFHPQVTLTTASDHIMKWLSSLMGVKMAFLIVPPLLGMVSAVMIYLILRRVGIDANHRLAITLLFITTPVFFSTFASGSLLSVSFTLVVAAVYFFLKKRAVFFFLSFVLYLVIPTLGITCLLVSIFPLAYSLAVTGSRRAVALLSAVLVSTGAYYGYILWIFGMPQAPSAQLDGLLVYFTSDLGGAPALGVFLSVLFIVGVIFSWKSKGRYLPFYLLAVLLFVVSLFDHDAILFLTIPVSAFAGIGVNELFKRSWRLPFIRDFSFILVICGVLFSIISFVDSSFMEGPSMEEIDSLKWLGRNVDGGTILTLPEAAQFVHTITGYTIVADQEKRVFSDNTQGMEDLKVMFESRNLVRTKELMTTYNISTVWIPSWEEEDLKSMDSTGLLFLFRNNETFKKIYPEDPISIWAFLPYDKDEERR